MCSLRRTLGTPEVSSTDSALTGLCSQKLWGFIFLALEPCAEGPCVWLGLLIPETSLPNFYPPHVDARPAYSESSLPLTSLDGYGFFNSVVVRLPFNSISEGCE